MPTKLLMHAFVFMFPDFGGDFGFQPAQKMQATQKWAGPAPQHP
jgi:hypothetical protein